MSATEHRRPSTSAASHGQHDQLSLRGIGPELSYRIVEIEELLCGLPVGHRLADQECVRVEDLVDDDFVSLPFDAGSILQATMCSTCLSAGFQPRITQIAPDSATVLALVAGGAGVTLTLSSVSPVQSVGIVYRPLAGSEPRHLFSALGWRTDNTSPALARVLAVSEEALPTPDLQKVDASTKLS